MAAEPAPDPGAAPESSSAVAAMRRDRAHVLLVEDSADDVLLIRRAFRRCGADCTISEVNDGDAAVAYLSGAGAYADRSLHPMPTLTLLDLKLPRRNGFEVLLWLRAQPLLRRLPVVVLTGSNQATDIARAYECGANSYLVKPVRFVDLQEMARSLGLYWLSLNERPDLSGSSGGSGSGSGGGGPGGDERSAAG